MVMASNSASSTNEGSLFCQKEVVVVVVDEARRRKRVVT
jgi:hypothetical protein